MTENKKHGEWWRGAVMYQIYPRSFFDHSGDGIGDLKGISEKLEYIASLGVDGIWLSPFFKSPMKDFGYDVSDYCDVDPLFGNLDDFDAFLEAAHKHKLKVLIDQVLSHTSNEHEWFIESRRDPNNAKADWYVWGDPQPDGTPPNNWLSVFGGSAWTYENRRGQYYLHNFLPSQPDLNVRNPEVQDALLDAMRFWLERGVDGFRLDTANFYIHDAELRDNPPRDDFIHGSDRGSHPYYWQKHVYDKSQPENIAFLKRLRALTDEYDARFMVAEIGDDDNVARSVEYTDGPEMLHTAYNFELLGHTCTSSHIRSTVENFLEHPGESWPAWSLSNHDVVRVASRWAHGGSNDDQCKMLMAMLCSLQGTIFVYQGEELGLTEADVPYEKLQDPYGIYLYPEDKGRDGCRTPHPWVSDNENAGFTTGEPWLPIPDEHKTKAVSAQDNDPESMLNFTRNFIKWRKPHQPLLRGKLKFINSEEPVLAFTRTYENEKMLAVFNLGNVTVTFKPEDGVTPVTGHNLPYELQDDGTIKLPAYGGFFGA